jgi:hypothetical protein
LNEGVAAVQASMPACIAIDESKENRLPNFIATGTQNIFPMLRKRKFN